MAKKLYIAVAVLIVLCLAGVFRWEEGRVEKVTSDGNYTTTQYLYDRWLQQEWVKINAWYSKDANYTQTMLPLDAGHINLKDLSTKASQQKEYTEIRKKLTTYTKAATWAWVGLIAIDGIIILGIIYMLFFRHSSKPEHQEG